MDAKKCQGFQGQKQGQKTEMETVLKALQNKTWHKNQHCRLYRKGKVTGARIWGQKMEEKI